MNNSGWIDFNPNHGSVTVFQGHLEGYAWSETIGWISFNGESYKVQMNLPEPPPPEDFGQAIIIAAGGSDNNPLYSDRYGRTAATIQLGKQGINAAPPPTIYELHPRIELEPNITEANLQKRYGIIYQGFKTPGMWRILYQAKSSRQGKYQTCGVLVQQAAEPLQNLI